MRCRTFPWALSVAVLSAPAPGGPPGQELGPDGWLDWASMQAHSAQAAIVRTGEQIQSTVSAWQREVYTAAAEQARAVEPPRGLFVFTASPDGPAQWLHADGIASKLPSRVVLLVHGLDEPGGIWADLAPALLAAGYTPIRFDYRNDDSARDSARELAAALRVLRQRGVQRVDIVAHSMGGLVSRDVLTSEAAYAGLTRGREGLPDVHRMITLGTPNSGSAWAHLAPLSDLREHVARWADEPTEPRHLLGFLADGDGHAGDDLLPGSAYLTELNARELPQGVIITAVVSQMINVEDTDLDWLTGPTLARRAIGAGRAREIACGLKDAASWLGDGVVCTDSGRSVCIEDVVEVPGNHRTMIRNFEVVVAARKVAGKPPPVPPAIPVVIERLGAPESPPAE